MYTDIEPCTVCGSPVELVARHVEEGPDDEPVGPAGGVVGTADGPVDERVCSNPDCASHARGAEPA